MTNYSFEPPARKAMDEAELSELISGMSADESGIEKAMKILSEQEALRLEDHQNFVNWRQAMIDDGSVEALRAIEAATGEVLIEPEPEPEPEPESEVKSAVASEPELSNEALGDVSEEISDQETDSLAVVADPLPEDQTEQLSSDDTPLDDETETTVSEDLIQQDSVTESVLKTTELVEESFSVTSNTESLAVSYQSVVVLAGKTKVQPSESTEDAMAAAVFEQPKKIRELLSSKFVLGFAQAAGIFSLLVISGLTLAPSNQWASIGVLVGVLIGFGLYSAQGFQKQSFMANVAQKMAAVGIYWKLAVLAAVSLLGISVSNIARDNRLFTELAVEPAKIFDYQFDEISLAVSVVVLFAAVIAWQPMLRFGVIRFFGVVALASILISLSALESAGSDLGDWDYEAFLAGAVSAILITVGLALLVQPSFASNHERPNWAIAEFSTRSKHVAIAHGVLFVLVPGVLAYLLLSSEVSFSQSTELAQLGLLISFGLGALIALIGVFEYANIYLRLLSLALVGAALIAGEFLNSDWVEGLSLIGLIVISALIGFGLVTRFFIDSAIVWVSISAVVLGVVLGWLVENPFGLLELGFEGYKELQGYGLGILIAGLISALVSLASIRKPKANENS